VALADFNAFTIAADVNNNNNNTKFKSAVGLIPLSGYRGTGEQVSRAVNRKQ